MFILLNLRRNTFLNSKYLQQKGKVYKVGHTRKFLYERIEKYGYGTQLINFRAVEDSYDTEQIIIAELKNRKDIFKLLPGKREFFKGKIDPANQIFCDVSTFCITLDSRNLLDLYEIFIRKIAEHGLEESYYSRILPRLSYEKNDLILYFILKFKDLEFQSKYEFAKYLNQRFLNIPKAIEVILT